MNGVEHALSVAAYKFVESNRLDKDNFFVIASGNLVVIGDKNGDVIKIEYEERKNRKFSFGGAIERASEEVAKYLLSIGALYVDENGIHASEPGIYPKKNPHTDRKSEWG